MTEKELSKKEIISHINDLKLKVDELSGGNSALLKIAQESFIIGRDSHLESLNPQIREELGLRLEFLTQKLPDAKIAYTDKKNKYLSLGKSYAAINFLFDLIDEDFSILDLLLLQEILMAEGDFREILVYITQPGGNKIEFDFDSIQEKVNEVFEWYNQIKEDSNISPIVVAVIFHYKLVSIHPFTDGNGRISRLILNLILLKSDFFPVSIPNELRKQYYESLMEADKGNYEAIVDYFSELIHGKLQSFLNIAKELGDIGEDKEFLVLSEDGNTSMISKLLEIHGLDLNKVLIESYNGKDNLASAIFFAKKLFDKSKKLKKILIHQDRDNNIPQQLLQIIGKHLRAYELDSVTTVLITKFYDIESYFLNENHINSIYPDISLERGKELILQATIETEDVSKAKLRKAYAHYGKYGKMEDPLIKATEINSLYDLDPVKYRYGKEVLYKLEDLITIELQLDERAKLTSISNKIKINEIEKFASF